MFLWPAHAWRRSLDGQHLTRPPSVGHGCGTTPLGRHQKQRPPVGASEHAGEAASIEIDRLQDLAALTNAHATLVGDVGIPDGVLCIEADTIGIEDLPDDLRTAIEEACDENRYQQRPGSNRRALFPL